MSQQKEFECKASYNGFDESQKYELSRISYNVKIYLDPPKDIEIDKINFGVNEFGILVGKNQALNMTCISEVGCNDINYDLQFITNSTVRPFRSV